MSADSMPQTCKFFARRKDFWTHPGISPKPFTRAALGKILKIHKINKFFW
jgi:hypothetical protein